MDILKRHCVLVVRILKPYFNNALTAKNCYLATDKGG
jgi:hypothetical protein